MENADILGFCSDMELLPFPIVWKFNNVFYKSHIYECMILDIYFWSVYANFYSYFWTGLFIFWHLLTDFLQNFYNSSLSMLVQYDVQIQAMFWPGYIFPLCILPTDLSTSTLPNRKFSQVFHTCPKHRNINSRYINKSTSFMLGIKHTRLYHFPMGHSWVIDLNVGKKIFSNYLPCLLFYMIAVS